MNGAEFGYFLLRLGETPFPSSYIPSHYFSSIAKNGDTSMGNKPPFVYSWMFLLSVAQIMVTSIGRWFDSNHSESCVAQLVEH